MSNRHRVLQVPGTGLPQRLIARRATDGDQQSLPRLWLLFRHHMSTWTGTLPAPDGSYRSEWLDSALSDATWSACLLPAGEPRIALAWARSLEEPVHVLNSFFLVIPARGRGLGRAF